MYSVCRLRFDIKTWWILFKIKPGLQPLIIMVHMLDFRETQIQHFTKNQRSEKRIRTFRFFFDDLSGFSSGPLEGPDPYVENQWPELSDCICRIKNQLHTQVSDRVELVQVLETESRSLNDGVFPPQLCCSDRQVCVQGGIRHMLETVF